MDSDCVSRPPIQERLKTFTNALAVYFGSGIVIVVADGRQQVRRVGKRVLLALLGPVLLSFA